MLPLAAATVSCISSWNEEITDRKNPLIPRAKTLYAFTRGYLKATALIPALRGHTGLTPVILVTQSWLQVMTEFLSGASGCEVVLA